MSEDQATTEELSISELNQLERIGAVRAIRDNLIAKGNPDPLAHHIYETYKHTVHSEGDEHKDRKYLYQVITGIRKKEKESSGDPQPTRRPGRPPASSKVTNQPQVTTAKDGQNQEVDLAKKFNFAIREVKGMVPKGMGLADFRILLSSVDRVQSEVGGVQALVGIVKFMESASKKTE